MDQDIPITAALSDAIGRAPEAPGCYLFRRADGKVLYIGKARLLRNRLRSYLRPEADGRPRIPRMVAQAASVECIVTKTEKEALVLENNLIKMHRPSFNIMLKDDKTYVSVRIDLRHLWPRARVVHQYKKDGATYIGPFTSGTKLRQTMEALKRVFPLRRCSDHVLRNRTRVCVYHDIGVCCGPCVSGKVTPERYAGYVNGLINLLRGKDTSVMVELERAMRDAAAARDFESAALCRDRLFALRETVQSQNVQLGGLKSVNRDVFGLSRDGDRAQIQVLFYRDDKLIGSASHHFATLVPDDELVEQFVQRYYEGERSAAAEVLLPVPVDDADSLGVYLSDKAGYRVSVTVPRRGSGRALIQLANLNAEHAMKEQLDRQATTEATLAALQEKLDLENIPRRMECYDVSHFQGDEVVASGVCFVDGVADKRGYRRYRLKTVARNDDYAALEEVLRRRIKRGVEEGDFPDLMVIDGGAAQLGRVARLFEELNVVGVDLIGLAKSRDRSESAAKVMHSSYSPRRVTDERVFLPGREEPIHLGQKSPELFLLMRLRDEAHRFAVTFHRERKRRAALKSGLDAIPGIGPKRKRALIRHFGSPALVKAASAEELSKVDGISPALAHIIAARFSGTDAAG